MRIAAYRPRSEMFESNRGSHEVYDDVVPGMEQKAKAITGSNLKDYSAVRRRTNHNSIRDVPAIQSGCQPFQQFSDVLGIGFERFRGATFFAIPAFEHVDQRRDGAFHNVPQCRRLDWNFGRDRHGHRADTDPSILSRPMGEPFPSTFR